MRKLILIVISTLLLSCNKEKITIDWQSINTGTQNFLYSLNILNDTLYITGGETYSLGEWIKIQISSNTIIEKRTIGAKAIYAALMDSLGNISACGYDGILYNSKNFGKDFNVIQTNLWKPLQAISKFNNWSVAVGGGGENAGVICVQEDSTWRRTELKLNNELRGVAVLNNTDAIAVGNGVILKTIDRGKNWKPIDINGDFFTDIQQIGNTIYVLGYSGLLLKSINAGKNWTTIKINKGRLFNRDFLNAFYFIDLNTGFICGNNGTILITENAGNTWQKIDGLDNTDFKDIIYNRNNNSVYACGSNGTLIQFVY